MRIKDYLSECVMRVRAIGGFLPGNEELETLKNLHPRQFIDSKIDAQIVKIRYEYETMRGHEREGEKFMFMNPSTGDGDEYEISIMAEGQFENWITVFNANNKYKQLLNVKILDICTVGMASVPLTM